MELVALNCNHCGAKLEVGETAKFVTCKHCDTQLAIKHEGDASYTELIDAAARLEERADELEGRADDLAERSEELSGQHEVLVLQNDLERLERDWEKERETHLVENKRGQKYEPTRAAATGLMFVPVVFIGIAIVAYTQTQSWFVIFAGLLAAVVTALGASSMRDKAKAFEEAHSRYLSRREELDAQLAEARRAAPPRRRRPRRAREDDEPDEAED